MKDRIAVYPGSFDPITNGHLDVVRRAAAIFDRLIVAVLRNPAKQPLFGVDERLEMIRQSVADIEHVEVDAFEGLSVEYATHRGALSLVRGLRATSDFDSEFSMALMNRKLRPEITTVFFMTSFANVYVRSSTIKEISSYGGAVEEFVPPVVAKSLRLKFASSQPNEETH